MKIAIYGANSNIGTHLTNGVLENNEIIYIEEQILKNKKMLETLLTECDILIDARGVPPIKKHSKKYLQELQNLSQNNTELLCKILNDIKNPPKKIIILSSLFIYKGNVSQSDRSKDYNDNPIANVAKSIEESYQNCTNPQVTKITLRVGYILAKNSEYIKELLSYRKIGIGFLPAKFAGKISWIHVDDLISIIQELIKNNDTKGIYNVSTPTNEDTLKDLMTKTNKNNKKILFSLPLPKFYAKFRYKELYSAIMQFPYIEANRLKELNHKFKYTNLQLALDSLV